MAQNVNEIENEIKDAMGNLDIIIEQENFSAYYDVRKSLNTAVKFLTDNMVKDCQKEISFSIRLVTEAPPKDVDLGYSTLLQLDSIYKKLATLIN